jgi:hypothetical protein
MPLAEAEEIHTSGWLSAKLCMYAVENGEKTRNLYGSQDLAEAEYR